MERGDTLGSSAKLSLIWIDRVYVKSTATTVDVSLLRRAIHYHRQVYGSSGYPCDTRMDPLHREIPTYSFFNGFLLFGPRPILHIVWCTQKIWDKGSIEYVWYSLTAASRHDSKHVVGSGSLKLPEFYIVEAM